MDHKTKYLAYAAATQTVARTKQIVMLYDSAIRSMQQAREAAREKRIEDRYHALSKATDIVRGLQSCLDFENGGNVAPILYGFYSMLDTRIFTIHRTGSPEACEEVIGELKRMRDAWNDIDRNAASKETSPSLLAKPDAIPVAAVDNFPFSA